MPNTAPLRLLAASGLLLAGASTAFGEPAELPLDARAPLAGAGTDPDLSRRATAMEPAWAALSLEAIELAAAGAGDDADLVINQARLQAPDAPLLLARHAVVDLYLGRHRDALRKLDDAVTGGLADAAVHLNRSLALRALGRYDEAQMAFQRYLRQQAIERAEAQPHQGPASVETALPTGAPTPSLFAPDDERRPDP